MESLATAGLTIFVSIYDFITFPVYLILQKPWKRWGRPQKWAEAKSGDPSGPYRKIREGSKYFLGMKTLDNLFRASVGRFGDKKMFGTRQILNVKRVKNEDGKILKKFVLGNYNWITLKEAETIVDDLARGLRSIGLNPKHKITILAETRVEWFLIAQACFRTNITVATCYTNLGQDGIVYGINQIDSPYLITTGDLLPQVKKMLTRTLCIRHIIYFEDFFPAEVEGFPENVVLMSFSELKSLYNNLGSNIQLEAPSPDDLALIMYTSGSTAEPKGVLITHKCVLNCSQGIYDIINTMFTKDGTHLAYLPLAHIYEVMCEILFLGMGVSIGYSSSLTMTDKSPGIETGSCKGDISILRPSYMSCVPLVLDRIRKSIIEVVEAKGTVFQLFFNFAIKYKFFWKKRGFQTTILNRLLFDRLRTILGGRLNLLTVGGAPLSPETQRFVETCLDVRLLTAYGMTETAGACTLADLDDYSIGKVGSPLCTTVLRLIEWKDGNYYPTDKPYPRGELLIGGDCVTKGYFKKEELTLESFREENGIRWFYTGDIVEIHSDGCVKVIDRKKDLVKLQFGEYVSLGKVESSLKTCPLVDNICVFGNGFLDYIVALVVPNRVQLQLLAKELGKEEMDIESLCVDKEMNERATKIIQRHGKSCDLMNKEIPKYAKLCSEEWLPETGFVTGALKVRRRVIQNFYKEALENLIKNH